MSIGGWMDRLTFKILMPSPNLLKSEIPCLVGEGGDKLTYQPSMLSPNQLKSEIRYVHIRSFAEDFKVFIIKLYCFGVFTLNTVWSSYTMCTWDHNNFFHDKKTVNFEGKKCTMCDSVTLKSSAQKAPGGFSLTSITPVQNFSF